MIATKGPPPCIDAGHLIIRGTVGELWGTKEHRDRALADATARDLNCGAAELLRCTAFQTACEKLVPLKRTVFLHFAAPAEAAASGCRAMLDHAVHAV